MLTNELKIRRAIAAVRELLDGIEKLMEAEAKKNTSKKKITIGEKARILEKQGMTQKEIAEYRDTAANMRTQFHRIIFLAGLPT